MATMAAQAAQALSEARHAPSVAVTGWLVLQRSPFCSACPADLAGPLEESLGLNPRSTPIWCWSSPGKRDGPAAHHKSCGPVAEEQSFALRRVCGMAVASWTWCGARPGPRMLTPEALEPWLSAIGSDSARLAQRAGEWLALYCCQRPH